MLAKRECNAVNGNQNINGFLLLLLNCFQFRGTKLLIALDSTNMWLRNQKQIPTLFYTFFYTRKQGFRPTKQFDFVILKYLHSCINRTTTFIIISNNYICSIKITNLTIM